MRYAVVYLPTARVMATRATEPAAKARASYIADRVGFSNVKIVRVDDSVKKGDLVSS